MLRLSGSYVSDLVLEHSPTGRRNASRPRKRWRDRTPMKIRKALNVLYIVADDNNSHQDVGTECALYNAGVLAERLSLIRKTAVNLMHCG